MHSFKKGGGNATSCHFPNAKLFKQTLDLKLWTLDAVLSIQVCAEHWHLHR